VIDKIRDNHRKEVAEWAAELQAERDAFASLLAEKRALEEKNMALAKELEGYRLFAAKVKGSIPYRIFRRAWRIVRTSAGGT
jgi:ClpP class serine protease